MEWDGDDDRIIGGKKGEKNNRRHSRRGGVMNEKNKNINMKRKKARERRLSPDMFREHQSPD